MQVLHRWESCWVRHACSTLSYLIPALTSCESGVAITATAKATGPSHGEREISAQRLKAGIERLPHRESILPDRGRCYPTLCSAEQCCGVQSSLHSSHPPIVGPPWGHPQLARYHGISDTFPAYMVKLLLFSTKLAYLHSMVYKLKPLSWLRKGRLSSS